MGNLLRRFFRPRWVRLKVRGRMAEFLGESAFDSGNPHVAAFRWLEATVKFWHSAVLAPNEEREMLLAEAQQCARRAASAVDRVADVLMWEERRVRDAA
jgi:hypothetical protein